MGEQSVDGGGDEGADGGIGAEAFLALACAEDESADEVGDGAALGCLPDTGLGEGLVEGSKELVVAVGQLGSGVGVEIGHRVGEGGDETVLGLVGVVELVVGPSLDPLDGRPVPGQEGTGPLGFPEILNSRRAVVRSPYRGYLVTGTRRPCERTSPTSTVRTVFQDD